MPAASLPSTLEPVLKDRYPHRPRVLFLLRRRPDVGQLSFERALRKWRRQRDVGVQFGAIIARAGAAMTEQQAALDEQFRATGADVTPIDGYVSLDLESYAPTPADFAALFTVAYGCLETLTDVIDPTESIALAGMANLVIPGFAPISMILVLDRLEGLSVEQYNQWWVRHGDDHRRLNPAQAGYHQLHIAPEYNALVAAATGTAVTTRCVVDIMYLANLRDALASVADPASDDARVLAADIGAHVSFASVQGSFMREL